MLLQTVICCVFLAIASSEEWFQTPHGLRPKECIINHNESNVIIDSIPGGLMINYPDSNRSIFYKSSEKCINNAKDIISKYKNRNTKDPSHKPKNGGWEIF
eukprot:450697_1